MSELYDDISDLSQPRIRLLTIEASFNPSVPISCTLTTHHVSALPEYGALSYVWGDASYKSRITCNGCRLEITSNLARALVNLRDETRPLVLWADAICINQSDLAERSSQVRLMGEIYRNAATTLIWLGDDDPHSDCVIDLCLKMETAIKTGQPASQITKDTSLLNPVLEFFKRPWWTRSWVIQELCLSSHPVLVVGRSSVPWALFRQIIWQIGNEVTAAEPEAAKNDPKLLAVMLHLMRSDGFVAARTLSNLKSQLDDAKLDAGLLDLLVEFRNFATTDQRDKVYALLSLVVSPGADVHPDYTTTAVETYTKAAVAILQSTQDLHLLEVLPIFERNRDPGLPSWVPQWDSESKPESPGMRAPSHVLSVAHTGRNRTSPAGVPGASKSIKMTHFEVIDPNILVLDGLIVDSLEKVGGQLEFPTQTHEKMVTVSSIWSTEFFQFALGGVFHIGKISHVIKDWYSLAHTERPYPTGEDRRNAFLGTVYGPEADLDQAGAQFDLAMRTHVPQTGWAWGVSNLLGSVSTISKHVFDGAMSMRTASHENAFGEALPNCWGKRLATTVNGYICLLPGTAELGDKLALLPGGAKPFVIRPAGNRWKVVGPCYVHGIMDGEAWSEDGVQRLEFV